MTQTAGLTRERSFTFIALQRGVVGVCVCALLVPDS